MTDTPSTREEQIAREELTDLISEAISDSIDMDWNPSIGARYVAEALIKEGLLREPDATSLSNQGGEEQIAPEAVWRVCQVIKGDCKNCPPTEVRLGEACVRGCYLQAVECINTVETGNPWRKTEDVRAPWVVRAPSLAGQTCHAMSDEQIKHMVNRFLGWRLPENFSPDDGISFKAEFNEHTAHPMKHEPMGTNLFDATQAEDMVRYMLAGLPPEQPDATSLSNQGGWSDERAIAQAKAAAFYDGFTVGIVREPWDDCYDWAACVGAAYANGDPIPAPPETSREEEQGASVERAEAAPDGATEDQHSAGWRAIIDETQNNDWAGQRAQPTKLRIGPYSLVLTCSACPEQYDVFLGHEQVGYLRLRNGSFRADAPDCGGETVYRAEPMGDGIFDPSEREHYLIEAIEAIDAWHALPAENSASSPSEASAGTLAQDEQFPSPDREEIDRLEKIAREATPGPWRRKAMGGSSTVLAAGEPQRVDSRIPPYGYDESRGYCLGYPFIEDDGDVRLDFVSFCHGDAVFISTFDPPTALRLLATARLAEELAGAVKALSRCLLPAHMTLAERDMIEDPVPDDAVVFSFMGSGASDNVTAGAVRGAIDTSKAALQSWEGRKAAAHAHQGGEHG